MSNSHYLREVEEKYNFEKVEVAYVEPARVSDVVRDIQQQIRDQRKLYDEFEDRLQRQLNHLQRRMLEIERGYRPF